MVTQREFCDQRDLCWKVYVGKAPALLADKSGPVWCGLEVCGATTQCERRPWLLESARKESEDNG